MKLNTLGDVIFLFFLAALSFCTAAYGQDGAHTHAPDPRIDDILGAIESLKAKEVEQDARLDALENEPDEPSPPVPPPAGEPSHLSGWVLNPNFAHEWSHENAFLNRAVFLSGNLPPPKWGQHQLERVRGEASGKLAEWYWGCWLLLWEGDASLRLGGYAGPQVLVEQGRRMEAFDGDNPLAWIEADGPDFSDVAFFPCEDEEAYLAGEEFDPDFVELVSQYEALRPLDWSRVNNTFYNSVDDLPAPDETYWTGGPPIEAQARLAVKSGVALWLNVPGMIGLPDETADAAAAVNTGNWKSDQNARLALYRAPGTLEAVLASDEWDRLADRIVAALDAAGYDEKTPFLPELSNEAWGTHFRQGEYFWGLAEQTHDLTGVNWPGQPMQGAYGLLSARLACALDKAFKKAGRKQSWAIVLNSQLTWVDQTRGALIGFDAFGECPSGLNPMDHAQVSVTGYWSGGFQWHSQNELFGSRLSYDKWIARWTQEFEKDPAGLANRIEKYITSGGRDHITNGCIVALSKEHAKVAQEYGARFLGQYEAGSHDQIDGTLKNHPGVMDFARDFMASEHTARIIADQSERMRGAFKDGVLLSRYHHFGSSYDPSKPWDLAPRYDETSPQVRQMQQELAQ